MPQHWSKDFIEHIRTVHFALLALCVAAIILATSRGQSEASRAHEEIDQVRELVSVSTWDPAFLQQPIALQRGQQNSVVGLSGDVIRIKIGRAEVLCKPEINGPVAYATLNRQNVGPPNATAETQDGNYKDARQLGDRIAAPSTLLEFADVWTALADGATIHRPLSVYDSVFATTGTSHLDENQTKEFIKGTWELEPGNPDPNTVKPLRLHLQRLRPSSLVGIKKLQPAINTDYQLHSTLIAGARYELYFPLEATSDQPLDAQALLLTKLSGRRHGRFEETFHDLDSVAREYKTADLATAEKIVTAEEGRTEQSFDAFGLKFPASTSVPWGLVMILVVQSYAWVLLGGVKDDPTLDEEARNLPWVGLYEFVPAQLLTWLSFLLLPVGAVAALGIRGLYVYDFAKFSWAICLAAIALSAILAFLTFGALPRARGSASTSNKMPS